MTGEILSWFIFDWNIWMNSENQESEQYWSSENLIMFLKKFNAWKFHKGKYISLMVIVMMNNEYKNQSNTDLAKKMYYCFFYFRDYKWWW